MHRRPLFSLLKSRRGMTLIETTVVLAVFSIVIAGIWIAVNSVMENAKATNTVRQLQSIVQNARQVWTSIPQLSGTTTDYTAQLDFQKIFPLEMRLQPGACATPTATNCGQLRHAWLSTANVTVYGITGVKTRFTVKYNNLPQKACISLAMRVSGGDVTNLYSLSINSGTAITGTSLPVPLGTASTQCNKTDSTNSLAWTFDIRA